MIIILMGMSEWTLAQKQNNIWYFGDKAGLDFNTIPPTPLQSDLITLEGTASICDPAGHLLFYTNGATVWDRNSDVMPNGTGLLGGVSSTQAALILPLPNSCSQYYLFTTEDHYTNGGLTYSIVDMCLNDGSGDIVSSSKNTLVVDRTAEKISAVLHANGVDIWILTHTLNSNQFLAFLLSASGLNTTPVISAIGSFYPSDAHIGPLKASHDGSKIVSSSTFHDICEMFDFNSATGQLSNFYDLNQLFNNQRWIYGIEFSSNDSLLYLSTCFITNYLYQLNIKSKVLITLNTEPGNYHYGALQMGPDKKIYMARNDSAFLDVIHQPDLNGISCQYGETGQALISGTISQLGLPNFAPYSVFPNSNSVFSLGKDTTLCIGDTYTLELAAPSNCQSTFLWNDGSTGFSKTINQAGLYWVEVQSPCSSFRDSIQVSYLTCQSECGIAIGSLFGASDGDERGNCLAASQENDGFYVAGLKNDSIQILKVKLSGAVEWSRTFDIVPGKDENVNSILLDSEGMLAVSGTVGNYPIGSSVFAFRYNPGANLVLWAREYVHTPRTNNFSLIQKANGGNYLMVNNPYYNTTDDCEILELNISTGSIEPAISINYNLGSSNNLYELIYDGNFVYGTGRYTDGAATTQMRSVLVKLNASTGNQVWVKLGHIPQNQSARLYGLDLIVDQGSIYSVYHGDPSGTSSSNTKLYIQKTNLDGDLIWLNQYELPGINDDVYEIIKSGNGYAILAGNRGVPTDLVLFKINADGATLWAERYQFPSFINEIGLLDSRSSQLIEVNNKLVFTGYASNSTGGNNMILVITDPEGKVDNPCIDNESISILVISVNNPAFYEVDPTQYSVNLVVNSLSTEGIETDVTLIEECILMDTLTTFIDTTICEGETYEGHTQSGTYSDTFITLDGCDSIRILHLTVNACQPECGMSNAIVFGSPDINERGYSLVATPEGDGSYVTGIREDSLLLLKINLNGAVQWSRTFDLLPDSEEYPYSLIVDSEGMLALVGTTDELSVGGVVFVMRYDPYNHQVLWSKEFENVLNSVPGGIIQKGAGGNYLLVNDLNVFSGNHIDVELLELNINTGDVVPTFSKRYRLSNRESLFEIVYDGQFIYGTGRYKEDNSNFNFRNTLVKLNPDDGTQVWVKMGHIPNNITARLYGGHLLIDQNEIISGSYGDPSGTSITDTRLYLQKTDLDGNVIWLKQYNISQTNSFCYGIIKSGNGYVVLSGKRLPNTELVMFKIDTDGEVLWAKTYQFSSIIDEAHINPTLGGRGQTKVIQVGNQLIFTGYGVNTSGQTDLMLVRTDLEGNVDMPCVRSQNFSLTAIEINDAVFFSVTPDEFNVNPVVKSTSPQGLETLIRPREECSIPDTLFTTVEATICPGDFYEVYSEAGTYIDTFISNPGCDSIRVLNLSVEMPDKFQDVSICSGGEFENYTMAGIYSDTIPGLMSDCDTIRYLTITITSALETFINHEICEGDSFLGYDSTGTFADTFQTVEGCDSIRILDLFVTNQIFSNIDIELCLGDNYKGYDNSGVYVDTLQAVYGCDSIVSLQLTIIPVETMIDVEICAGSHFENYSLPGTFVDTLKGVNSPCDTIREINLTVLPAIENMVEKSICNGEDYFGYSLSGIYTDTIITNAGCDSIRTVSLEVTDHISTTVEASLCEGALLGYVSAGTYLDTLIAQDGCDSIRTLNLTGASRYIPNVFSPNDDGINDLFTVFQFPDNTLEFEYFAIFDRFGDMTYETDQWPIHWNGKRSGGESFQPAVFAYILIYHCGDKRLLEHGNITILK